ncbi:MAG: formate dehydrogenase accessory sulfurtransferase FdhD [Candidatus Promineifilaceae bacterium]
MKAPAVDAHPGGLQVELVEAAGILPSRYLSLGKGTPLAIEGQVVAEAQVCISVNGREIATFMCTPRELIELAVGFLYNEGLIQSAADVRSAHVSQDGRCVDVWLWDSGMEMPSRAIKTAGCGGGLTFDDLSGQHAPLESSVRASPHRLAELMRDVHLGAALYQQARGIHTAALADETGTLLQVEDMGRHNCLDKLAGAALARGLATEGLLLFSSGRISSEMINKARRLRTPIVCSRTSPTSLSLALAEAWNMAVVAYLRQDRMRVYTHAWRLEGLPAGG